MAGGRARAGPIDAAVVGEPTNLEVAVAQRGLMMVDLVARGDQRHAGYAAADGGFTNAITALAARPGPARRPLRRPRPSGARAAPTVTPTMLEAGVSRNVTPPVARAVLDIRSTPAWTHAELADGARGARSSARWSSPPTGWCRARRRRARALLAAARRCGPQPRPFGSPTCSDWVFLRHADAIKCGPGTSRRSHTADEYVDLAEVTAARGVLRATSPGVPRDDTATTPRPTHALDAPADDADRADAGLHRRATTARGMRGCCRWDVLGSLGHVEGAARLRAALARADHAALRAGLRAALAAVDAGALVIGARHEDAHTAVEDWLTRRLGRRGRAAAHRPLAQRPGRLRPPALPQGRAARRCTRRRSSSRQALLALRRAPPRARSGPATPISAARCRRRPGSGPAAFAEGLLDTLEIAAGALGAGRSLAARQRRGVRRAAAAPARGRGAGARLRRRSSTTWPRCSTAAASSRPRCSSGAPSWATTSAGSRQDVILFSGEEFGFLVLPRRAGHRVEHHAAQAEPRSLRADPRRGPRRSRATSPRCCSSRRKLTGGYHRDFQLLKEPLFRGLDRTGEMLAMMARGRARGSGWIGARCAAALAGGALATDEVMRRVEAGEPFRRAYREVAAALKRGRALPGAVAAADSSRGAGRPAASATSGSPRCAPGCARAPALERARARAASSRAAATGAARGPERGADDRRPAASATSRSWS